MLKRTAALAVLMLVLAACGLAGPSETDLGVFPATTVPPVATTAVPEASGPGDADDQAFPVTVAAGNGEIAIEARPEAIVSLSPTATEMLFAVGAGSQVVAVDEYSTFPPEAPITDLSGFAPNIEAIVSYDPDLVIVSNDIDDVVAALETLAIPVLVMPAVATIDGIFEQMEQIGAATGHAVEAGVATSKLREELEAILTALPEAGEGLTYYHELDPTFFSVTSSTFIGQVYATLGLVNIADPADADGFGYPQLSVEHIVESDPDLIFVTDCCGETLETVAARAGWSSISAVLSGSVIVVDDDIASRWGPRTIDFLRVVAEAVTASTSAGG